MTLKNTGSLASTHTVLLLMSYSGTAATGSPAPALTLSGTGCTGAGATQLVQALVGWRRTPAAVAPGGSVVLTFPLAYARSGFASNSWAGFGPGNSAPPCGVYSLRFNKLGAGEAPQLRLRLA